MKLKSLLALSALTAGVTVNAQTTIEAPVANFPAPKTTALVQDSTTAQYLYNVGAKGFLRGANEYMTRATLDDTLGYKFKVQVLDKDNKLVALSDSVLKFSAYMRMFADGNEGIWVDNDKGPNSGTWQINEIDGGNGTFTISNTAYEGYLLGGVLGNRPASMPASSTSMGIYVNLYDPTTEDFQTTWAAVSEADYDEFHEAYVAPYNAKLALYDVLAAGLADYPSADFSSVVAVYNNESATAAELRAQIPVVADIIKAYIAANKANASLSNPIDVTSEIEACDLDNVTASSNVSNLWFRKFTGSGEVGSLSKNTWSSEGSSDGTNVLTPFLENWVAAGSTLSDQICAIDTVDVTPGVYKITARVRLYNESGASSIQGASLFGNFQKKTIVDPSKEVSTEISTGADGYFTYNNMLGYYAPAAETYAIVGSDGKLTFGVEIADANYNWQAHKDYKVYYLGKSQEAIDAARATECRMEKISDDVLMTASIKEEINGFVDTYTDASSTPDQVMEAVQKYTEKANSSEVAENQAAWAAYKESADKGLNILQSGAEGDAIYNLSDYIDETYTPATEELELTTAQVVEETAKLDEMIEAAKLVLPDGYDMTEYLVNPDFSKGTTGWEGGVTVNASCGEKYGTGKLDVYQEVKNLPVGVYEISVQGFYRQYRDDDDNKIAWYNYFEATEDAYTKKTPAPDTLAYVYLDGMKTALQCVYDYKQELTLDENNAYVSSFYGSGFSTDPYNKYAYPNTMTTAAKAFADGAYTVKAYGIVAKEGDVIKIGVKGDLTPGGAGNNWAIFDNFKLKYRAMNADIIEGELLPVASSAIDFSKKFGSELKEQATAAQDAIKTAEDTKAKFEALANLYAIASKVDESVAVFDELKTAYTSFESTVSDNTETAKEDVVNEATDLYGKLLNVFDGDASLTTDEATEAIAKMEELSKKLRYNYNLLHELVANASADAPADITDCVVLNNSFEQGSVSDWDNAGSLSFAAQSNTAFGKDGTYYAEKWHADGTLDMSQTIDGEFLELPAGTYRLTALAHCTTGDGVLYANEMKTDITNTTDATAPNADAVLFTIEANGDIKFGVSATLTSSTWCCVDLFKLEYLGTDVTGVESVIADTQSSAKEVYSINGVKLAKMQKGINIVRTANGVKKVVIK